MTVGITVVGGSYGEECSFPRSIVYRRSGRRAASVLAGLGNRVTLDTFHGPLLATEFTDICRLKDIATQLSTADSDVRFRYRHALSKPDIYPSNLPLTLERTEVNVACVLVSGMIEGRPKVKAQRAIYDPQDGFRAKPLGENGSSADGLVMLASLSEGRALTGKQSAEEIASHILAGSACIATVIRCGPRGALVATPEAQKWIGAFPSSKMWKIGSGDVFSAAFAHKWFAENATVLEAAWFRISYGRRVCFNLNGGVQGGPNDRDPV